MGFMVCIALALFSEYKIPLLVYSVILGLDIIYINTSSASEAAESKTWPIYPANLLDASAIHKRYNGSQMKWFLKVKYQYKISGITYTNDNYNWVGLAHSNKDKIQNIVETMKKQSNINLHVSPKDPTLSVIEPKISLIYPLGILIGLTFCTLPIYYGINFI